MSKYLSYSFLLNKEDFINLLKVEFGLDPIDEGKKLYKILKVKNPQGKKWINVQELLSVLLI